MQRMESLLFELNPNPMIIYDIESLKILDVNEAGIALYGYSHKEFLELTYADIQSGHHKSALFKILAKTPSGFENTGIWQHQAKDGTVLHVELVDRPYEYDDCLAKILVVRDLSGFVAQEEELRMAQEQLRMYTDNSPVGVLEWTPDLHLKSVSKKGQQLLCADEKSLTGRSAQTLLRALGDPALLDTLTSQIDRFRSESGINGNFEVVSRETESGRFYTRWYNSAILDEDEKVAGYISLVEDVTCCRRATLMLEQSDPEENIARKVLLDLEQMVLVLAEPSRDNHLPFVVFANQAFADALGIAGPELEGIPADSRFIGRLPAAIGSVITSREAAYAEDEAVHWETSAGNSKWLHPRISTIESDPSGTHRVIIFEDVTEIHIRREFMQIQRKLHALIAGRQAKERVLNEVAEGLNRLFPQTKARITTIDENFTRIYGTPDTDIESRPDRKNGHSGGIANGKSHNGHAIPIAEKIKEEILAEDPLHHCWSVPIPSGQDTSLGALTIGYLGEMKDFKAPDPLLKEIAEYFARLAGLAMEYGSAGRSLVRFSRLMEGIAGATTQLHQCSDLTDGLESAIARLGEASEADRILVFSRNETDEAITLRQQWSREAQPAYHDEFPMAEIQSQLTGGKPFSLDLDFGEASLLTGATDTAVQRSLLIIPIETDRSCWGGLGLDRYAAGQAWSTEEELALVTFATNVGEFVQRNQTEQKLSHSQEQLELALKGAEIGMWELNFRTNEYKLDNHWKEFLGFTDEPSTMPIDSWKDRLHPEDRIRVLLSTRVFLNGEQTLTNIEQRMLSKSGEWRWILSRGKIVECDEDGIPIRACGTYQDITERKRAEEKILSSLKEKEILLAEIHHRVKNNMAVISGLIQLQAEEVEDERLRELLYESQMRIHSMAMIHEKLYQSAELSNINYGEYIADLARTISKTLQDEKKDIRINIHADEVVLTINQAIPCALILNEILTNAYKHGFRHRQMGCINIYLRKNDDQVTIGVENDGEPLPSDFNLQSAGTLGLTLIQTLAHQLEARLKVVNEKTVHISFEFQYQE